VVSEYKTPWRFNPKPDICAQDNWNCTSFWIWGHGKNKTLSQLTAAMKGNSVCVCSGYQALTRREAGWLFCMYKWYPFEYENKAFTDFLRKKYGRCFIPNFKAVFTSILFLCIYIFSKYLSISIYDKAKRHIFFTVNTKQKIIWVTWIDF
jgi:hypothetical protein